jgi:predicted ribosome quality control (RQC) complex YloA/Tae2 family protein
MFPFKKEFSSISAAMDEFYARRARNNFLSQKKGYLVKLVNQKQALIARKIIIHNKDMEECRSMDQNKKYGDLILANLYRMRAGQKELTASDYYQENSPELLIPLQTTLSGSQNAQKYYKRYNKLKSKFESVSNLLDEEKKQLDYFSSVQVSLSNVSSIVDIDAIKEELHDWDTRFSTSDIANNMKNTKNGKDKYKKATAGAKKKGSTKKPAAIPPRQYRSSDGFEILIGRNNLQNDILTMKTAHKDDIWLHIQKAPGTHVIIRTNREVLPDSTLEEAAMLAAWYSKNSEAGINTKAVIDYCPVRNVWKPKNATPGHVLYRDFKSITVKTNLPQTVKELNNSSS